MNINKQNPYKGPVRAGDYFSIGLKVGGYILGRIIRHEASDYPILGEYLIYIYSGIFEVGSELPRHGPSSLMLPPLFVNKTGWTRGYFGFIKSSSIQPDEVLKEHCFSGCYFSPTGFVNEFGEAVSRSEPCGAYGLDNYKMVDYYISEKLGLSLDNAGVED